jgi:hypothetical protein
MANRGEDKVDSRMINQVAEDADEFKPWRSHSDDTLQVHSTDICDFWIRRVEQIEVRRDLSQGDALVDVDVRVGAEFGAHLCGYSGYVQRFCVVDRVVYEPTPVLNGVGGHDSVYAVIVDHVAEFCVDIS